MSQYQKLFHISVPLKGLLSIQHIQHSIGCPNWQANKWNYCSCYLGVDLFIFDKRAPCVYFNVEGVNTTQIFASVS